MLVFHDGATVRRLFDDDVCTEEPKHSDAFVIDRKDRREDLDVQVRLAPRGLWHKKAIGGLRTACGVEIGDYATRGEAYAPPLCPTCFTPYEHKLAEAPTIEYPGLDPKR